ncbi:MAG: hypothetical protein IPG71_08790 [bacterium]|nr:hypothetical protein [bacterium]
MFRPINSDDHTLFRPPADHVKQSEAAHQGQKRDFGLEIDQVDRDKRHKHEQQQEGFGEDTFERTDSQTDGEERDAEHKPNDNSKENPGNGHVDVQA